MRQRKQDRSGALMTQAFSDRSPQKRDSAGYQAPAAGRMFVSHVCVALCCVLHCDAVGAGSACVRVCSKDV